MGIKLSDCNPNKNISSSCKKELPISNINGSRIHQFSGCWQQQLIGEKPDFRMAASSERWNHLFLYQSDAVRNLSWMTPWRKFCEHTAIGCRRSAETIGADCNKTRNFIREHIKGSSFACTSSTIEFQTASWLRLHTGRWKSWKQTQGDSL